MSHASCFNYACLVFDHLAQIHEHWPRRQLNVIAIELNTSVSKGVVSSAAVTDLAEVKYIACNNVDSMACLLDAGHIRRLLLSEICHSQQLAISIDCMQWGADLVLT